MKKEPDLSDLSPKKIQKVLMKIDVLANNFVQHTFDFSATYRLWLEPKNIDQFISFDIGFCIIYIDTY